MQSNQCRGVVADGVPSIQFEGQSYHYRPCDRGLVVQTSSELVLVGHDGETTRFGSDHVGTWYPRQAGIAVQRDGDYLLVDYGTGKETLLYQQEDPWTMHCCNSGIIIPDFESRFLYVPFDGTTTPRVFWEEDGTSVVVSDGIVIGSRENRRWIHASVSGESRVIYADSMPEYYRSGINPFGHVMAVVGDDLKLYHWDGREPAVARHYFGTCSQGMVQCYTHQIYVAFFGGDVRLLWDGHYDDWSGSCNEGLFIIAGSNVRLAPYDGSAPRTLWTGPFERLIPCDQALLVMNPGQVTMIPVAPS